MDRITAFGQVVREARLAKGLSQERLAEMADLHRNFVSLVERGQSKIALDSLFSIADALGCPASELLSRTELMAQRHPDAVR
ncbi:helix-turn-helix domain-containing protein [Ralstonia nicotianae]|uniref:Helix-turn-helix domain-containing protein n=1 Tax=Ralstonia nicotianae TaxID=3037696 RepID=A0ABX7ZWD8_9RALS|nr:helix-turn-helix transcriptional regulator [Ralstonia nicotianae]QUP59758.1 helix-turn-helix domain-containing protein [Ralstonia nicotianae]